MQTSRELIDALLRRTLSQSSLKDAVATVAEATGQPRKDVYRRALQLVKHDDQAHD
jgi:16S rRNA (cytidine1402-2'-O)-methyltransferase